MLTSHSDSCFRESLSDNLNRTIANLREIFNDHGFDILHFQAPTYPLKQLKCPEGFRHVDV